ncbi:hypothetical protein FF1_012436 [Malus domestica]
MGEKKKKATLFIRLISAAGTGFFYVKKKPSRVQEKLEFRKFDPRRQMYISGCVGLDVDGQCTDFLVVMENVGYQNHEYHETKKKLETTLNMPTKIVVQKHTKKKGDQPAPSQIVVKGYLLISAAGTGFFHVKKKPVE